MTVVSALFDVVARGSSAMALSVGLVAAATATPAPANADVTSDNFLTALTNSGVSVTDPNVAVTMAQSICPTLSQPGRNFAGVASRLGGTDGISPGMANAFTSIAISMYCPSMMASLADGNWLDDGAQPGLPGLATIGVPGV
jgi:hypothetical protein